MTASRVMFVNQLPEEIKLRLYSFPGDSYTKGIKKSGRRPYLRQLVQQDLPDHVYSSRAYCGNQLLQVYSHCYEVGCDLEQTARFRHAVPFFTTEEETAFLHQLFPHLQEHELLCMIWGFKEGLTKLLRQPLHLLLSSGWLGIDSQGITLSSAAARQHTPIQVYNQRRGTAMITITFYEKGTNPCVWHRQN